MSLQSTFEERIKKLESRKARSSLTAHECARKISIRQTLARELERLRECALVTGDCRTALSTLGEQLTLLEEIEELQTLMSRYEHRTI